MRGVIEVKKVLAIIFITLAALGMTGCGSEDGGKDKVVMLFPNPNFGGIWSFIGDTCDRLMREAGYDTEVHFCVDANEQISQLSTAIAQKPAAIVIAAQDTGVLGDTLASAKTAGIPVIAYDRIIMHTDALSYYASFENNSVGEFQARYVEEKLNLKSGAGPFNIEFIAGDPADTNAPLFIGGAIDYLKRYIDNGQLIVPSGQIAFRDIATDSWSLDNAQRRMEQILRQYYSDGKPLHVVIASNDDLAQALINAENNVGYSGPMTILTGQDASEQAIANIKSGRQSMTIYKDPAVLCAKIVRMVKAVVEGSQPAINDTTTIKNDVMTIPSYLCIPVIVDRENISMVE